MKKFFQGILFGSVVGAATGLLFAPKSGRDTRQSFKDQALDLSDAKTAVDQSKQRLEASIANLKDAVDLYMVPFSKDMEKTMTDFKFQIEPRIEQLNEQVEKIQKKLPDNLIEENNVLSKEELKK